MSLSIAELASLPVAVSHGVGGKIGHCLYAGLGSAGKQFFVYDLVTPEAGWQAAPAFPGTERNDAVSVVCGDRLYVFSGAGVEVGSTAPVVLTDAWLFDAQSQTWSELDTEMPVGLLGASGCEMEPDHLYFWGGYCKETFDNFLREFSQIDAANEPEKHRETLTVFMSQPIKAYGWNRDIWRFNVQTLEWSVAAQNPFPANCGAALVRKGDEVLLIEGEVKPGLRSLTHKVFRFQGTGIFTSTMAEIVEEYPAHEGLAGHFAAPISSSSENGVLVAGGAYFVGSQANFRNQHWYTHQGLSKHFDDKIWCFDGAGWKRKGRLPIGCAYGITLYDEEKVYLIGGETDGGQALSRCFSISR